MKKQVGKIVNTQGIRGEVRVLSNSDFKDIRFKEGNKLEVKMRRESEMIEIERHYQHKNFDILKLKGYDNINDVIKFKNGLLMGEPLQDDALGDGEYFVEQIVGLDVVDQDGNKVGVVKAINTQSYQKLLTVKTSGKDAMIPYVDHFVDRVDLATNTMHVNLIPGLIDED
ncbi:ribosome maturation factor RimM [Mollicutes bacterium LVI A0078]|nr:ribosome maturation factor RimM [Mollicutes bacterium LVI A0075]WOO90346.1 ribosome maturation factor RimM [Mollicutes bacterium LVI A0078]